MSDPDKSHVYAAEDQVYQWLNGVTPERRTVNCLGATYQPEDEVKFTDPAAVQSYVDKVLDHLRSNGFSYSGREHIPVTVRARRGARGAHYRRDGAVMSIPPRSIGGAWALRELVVLHELAHHLAPAGAEHGPDFRATLVRLLENIGSPVIAHLVQGAFSVHHLNGVLPEGSDDRALDQLAKILRQAESTSNEHERELFMSRAQRLATKHSIALAVARAHSSKKEVREEPGHRDISIGRPRQRGLARYVRLFLAIAEANDLRCTIRSDSTIVGAYGFPSDIEVAVALYGSLVVQMVAGCEHYLRHGEREMVRTWSQAQDGWVTKPVPTITARLAFYEAFTDRIRGRLMTARREEIDRATAAEASSPYVPVSTALALQQKSAAVRDFYQEQLRANNVRGSWDGGSRFGKYDASRARAAGDAAARRASLTGETRRSLSR